MFLRFKVNADGSVSDVHVFKGDEVFRKAAVEAISQFRFKPAEHEGKPVAVWMSQRVSFQLEDQSSEPGTERTPTPPQTGPADVLEIDRVETKPRPIRIVWPGYPNPARRRAQHKGEVVPVSRLAPENIPQAREEVFEFLSVDEKPVVSHAVEPIYPDAARKARLTGNVFLKFKVNVDGSVSDVNVIKGNVVFEKPAIDAASQYRFIPAKHDGKPVAVWMTHRIKFQPPGPNAGRPAEKTDAEADKVYEFWNVDIKPVVTHSVQPFYPDSARIAGITGAVFVKFKVNTNGSVTDERVLKGNAIFHEPAIDATSQYRFSPARKDGNPVAVWMTLRLRFHPPKPKTGLPEGKSDKDGETVFVFSDVDVKPVNLNLHDVRPHYPDSAIEAGLTGSVFLKFKINVDGSVSDVRVLKADEIFRKPAIEAVKRFRYQSAELDGKPVPVWMTQRIAFALPKNQDETVSDTSDTGVGD